MTGICIARFDDYVTILSDGAAYDDEGVMQELHCKTRCLPHARMIYAVRGSAGSGEMVDYVLGARAVSFDQVIASAEVNMGEVAVRLFQAGLEINCGLFLGGYSDERAAWETYHVFIRGENPFALVEGSGTVTTCPWFFADPWPSEDELLSAGLLQDGKISLSADDDGLSSFMEAVRRTPYQLHLSDESPVGYGVGGFILRTDITSDGTSHRLLRRWPDMIGEKIDPFKEDATAA
ncbi:hypothetical protein JZX87_03445 [Agrobacterium sp. Ap1]|uniref:hypothetical protein n=1 Tax=Agrobacterium sp. Ap1 TaxID=2815337 RepID=UPI001A8E4FBB|nr:hypothetical protein [Agrobacterium sp. Ap1]MBO0140221.1 hypothetical protein [Agrobacterium sp. Ap1]